MDCAADISIDVVSPGQHAEALRLVFSRVPADTRASQTEQTLSAIASGKVSSGGLLIAQRGRRLVGAVLAHLQPGKTALLWPPRVAAGEPPETAAKLVEAARDFADGQGVRLVQALIFPNQPADAELLEAGGFEFLAELLYLVSVESDFPHAPPRTPLRFETHTAADHGRLVRLVEATYQQSLDCPRLNGVREMEDVLAGYQSEGTYRPEHWLIVRHQEEDVGCLLLADYPEHDNMELVYMGLTAMARGRGWGMDITKHAQWLAGRAPRQRLVLAVDAANAPAIAMYAAAGFQTWDRRNAFVKISS